MTLTFDQGKTSREHSLPPVALRGVDHLALVTADMAATIDFYTTVLGFPLVHVRRVPYAADRGQPPYDNLRHYFFDMGNDTLLAFFEYPGEAPVGNRDSIGSMQHLAFHSKRDDFYAMIQRLEALKVDFAGPIYLGDRFTSIYFYDPNNIRLEVTTDVGRDEYATVSSVYQSEAIASAELATLYGHGGDLGRIVHAMPRPPEASDTRAEP